FNSDGGYITMQVNDGDAVSIMNSSNTVGSGTTIMRIDRYTATGIVGQDGNLTLTINVKLGANVHWLSWRDVKYTKLDEASFTVNSKLEYGTFCAPFEVAIPEGVTAYTIDDVESNGTTLKTTELSDNIPANTPVLLYAEGGYAEKTVYGKAEEGTPTEGIMTGVYEETSAPVNSYVLQYLDNKAGFYQVELGNQPKVKANRAYLTLSAGANVRALFFPETGEATGIEAISALTSGNYDAIYTANGAKVQSLQKGLNIVVKDGKSHKIFVK
ncbi:MAG: hypothetical protein IKQ62_04925, partial [Bacteroidaceae bacterium]|nr:hypothetical protein [Bacteroidaceae bacterium]